MGWLFVVILFCRLWVIRYENDVTLASAVVHTCVLIGTVWHFVNLYKEYFV